MDHLLPRSPDRGAAGSRRYLPPLQGDQRRQHLLDSLRHGLVVLRGNYDSSHADLGADRVYSGR